MPSLRQETRNNRHNTGISEAIWPLFKSPYLCDLLSGDFYGVFLLTAVVQRGTVHVLVVECGQVLHLLPDPRDLILDLEDNAPVS